MGRVYQVALTSLISIFFINLFSIFGFAKTILPYFAALTVIMVYALSRWNISLGRREFKEKYVKPMVLEVGGKHILQEVVFDLSWRNEILLNIGGSVFPLFLSLILFYHTITLFSIPPSTVVVAAGFLTVVYNRLATFMKGKGLGVPLAAGVAVTTGTMLSLFLSGGVSVEGIYLLTFSSSVIAALVGIDVMNLKNSALFRTKYVIIGGMGPADAILILPVMSSLLVNAFVTILT